MLLLTGIKPLVVVFEEKAIILHKKLMQTNFCSDQHYIPSKLETQNGFTQSVREQASRLGMDTSLSLENQVKFTNPLDYFNLNGSLCLGKAIVIIFE